MGLKEEEVLLARKLLYGITESGLHWFLTYHTHHVERLDMNFCITDTCVLYRRQKRCTDGVTALQVDDSYGHGNDAFLRDEDHFSRKFEGKPRNLLRPGDSAVLNGCRISVSEGGVPSVDQKCKLHKLSMPTDKDSLVSTRPLIQYMGSCTTPNLCAPAQLLSPAVSNPDAKKIQQLTKIVRWCHDASEVGLKFVPLDTSNLRLLLFTDPSFANANKLKSQLGFVVVIAGGYGKSNIVHYGSTTYKRVARSVMAAELHGLVYGFDNTFNVHECLREVLGKNIGVSCFVDSLAVFNVVAKNASIQERRLQIVVNDLRESYHTGELSYLAWIPGTQNIADALTKDTTCTKHPLLTLMTRNELYVSPEGWVDDKMDP